MDNAKHKILLSTNKKSKPALAMQKINSNFESNNLTFVQGNIYTDNFFCVWQTKYCIFRDRSWTKTGKCAECKEYKSCQGNGFHYWHGDKKNVLVCHNEQLKKAINQ